MELTKSQQAYRDEKDRQTAEFLKNANKLADKNDLFITAGRKKIHELEYFMRMQKHKFDFSALSKNAMQILLYCEQEVDFFNIVAVSKKEIAKQLKIKMPNFATAYKELVQKNLLLNTDFSRKYLVIHPSYGFKGGVTEWRELKFLADECWIFKNLKNMKDIFDEKFVDILKRKNDNYKFDIIKKNIIHNNSNKNEDN